MAINKQQIGRYHVIDKLLSNGDRVKTSEMQRAVLYELDEKVSARTINNDINHMRTSPELGYFAPIEKDRSKKAFYYSDPDYTIRAFGLRDSDINALQFYASTINQYKEYELFKDFAVAIEKVLAVIAGSRHISGGELRKPIVLTERTPLITGGFMIPQVIDAINNKRYIEFTYQKFEDEEPKFVRLMPYLLKEDRHLWYVLGKNDKEYFITYALDRITNLEVTEATFIPDVFDFDDYFKYSFGITVLEKPPVIVVLSFTEFQGKYIKALPIHPTQEILVDSNKELRITVEVKPSYEFFEKILGYGSAVKVISPAEVVDEMKQRLKDTLLRYE